MKHRYILVMIVGFVIGFGDWMFSENDGGNLGISEVMASNPMSQQPGLVHVRAVEASGNWFSFARMSDGTVYVWGNYFGDTPVQVEACRDTDGSFIPDADCESLGGTLSDLTEVKDLSTGQNHTLALLDNDTPADISDDYVVAWGRNGDGQLGDGDPRGFESRPVQVVCGEMADTEFCSSAGTLQGVAAVAAGGGQGGYTGHSLALLSDGSLVAWGWNGWGQLGNGDDGTSESTPVRVSCGEDMDAHCIAGHLVGVTSIEGSAASSFAILSDSTMLAWGFNNRGWLGDGTTTPRFTPVFVSCGELAGTDKCSATSHLQGVTRLAKDPTSGFTLVLLSDGTAAAWGFNRHGRLGNGTDIDSPSPVRVRGLNGADILSGVTEVASGSLYSLALLSDGTVAAWGNNYAGQLGDGTTTWRLAPVEVIGLSDVVDIAAGYDHSHALLSDGTIIGWGNNNTSQLGLEAAGGVSTPVHVMRQGSPLSEVSALSAGIMFSRALQWDESLLAWGGNTSGQLGDGTTTDRYSPIEVLGLGSGSGVTAIATGSYFSLALQGGAVLAWGSNTSGQLGDGSTTDSPIPIQVPDLSDVAAIASHPFANHSLALTSDGTVLAWGANAYGQLGDGTEMDSYSPIQVSGLGPGSDVTAIAAGSYNSLALLSDGSVLEWGGGLTNTPQPVVGLPGVATALGSRGLVSMAVLDNGTVFEWTVGQTPVQRSGLADVTAIAGGASFSLALKSDGTVLAWGQNGFGQLGDGTTRGTGTPVQVVTCRDSEDALITTWTNSSCAALGGTLIELTGVTAVAAGYDHSLAVLSDGTALAWGSRGSGQLGDGSPGAFFTEPSVLMVLGSRDGKLELMPGLALVIATESTIDGKIEGDFTNLMVVGSQVTLEDKIEDVGFIILDGSQIRVSGEVSRVENVRVTANGSATIQGELYTTLSLILEEGSTLTVTGEFKCESDSGVTLDPSATLDVEGEIACPAIGTN